MILVMCVCVCVKLHITSNCGPVIIAIICHSVYACVCVFIKLHIKTSSSALAFYSFYSFYATQCMCVCVFIELHITAQSGPAILVILCHSVYVCVYLLNCT